MQPPGGRTNKAKVMQRAEAQTSQFGLVGSIRQERSDLIALVEPASPFAPESRKGRLYLLVEVDPATPRGAAACQLVLQAARTAFYSDSSFSSTSCLRAAIRAANKALYEQNFKLAAHQRAYVGLTAAVLRDGDLYLAQVQPAQVYLLSEGRLRALPAHPSWDPAHVSATPFSRTGALGTSLFSEPELYRASLRLGEGAILCSSNFARLLSRVMVEAALRASDPVVVIGDLRQLADKHQLADAHALAITLRPLLTSTAHELPLSPTGIGERSRILMLTLGAWFGGLADVTLRRGRPHSDPRSAAANTSRPDPLRTMPTEPPGSPQPIPRPPPLVVGESLDELHTQMRQSRADTAPVRRSNLPPSTFLGETPPGKMWRVDLGQEEPVTPPQPYRPRFEHRPLVDLSWPERLALPFRRLAVSFEDRLRARQHRRPSPVQRAPILRGQGLSYRRTRPPFPWVLLLGLSLSVVALIFYGLTLTRENEQQVVLEYFTAAEQQLAGVRQATTKPEAVAALELSRQAIEEVQASPSVTTTNPTLWLRFQELEREYERALAAVQGLTFFESPTVVVEHPLPNGRFASVVVPPVLIGITDTTILEGLQYIYTLDADNQAARLYRFPRNGGAAQPYLSPGQTVGSTVIGPLRAILWRIDQVVAIDQAATGFGYYFRSNAEWNYSKLGASEIWSLRDRLDVEEYGGNLYVWGAQPNEVLRFRSGSYNDTPDYWLDPAAIAELDLSTVVDMSVDGSVYLLRSNGSVLIFSQGQPVGAVTPEAINPPISLITGFSVTGSGPDDGFFFLVDTLNERVIQMEKFSGRVIQQIKTRADAPVQLNELASLFVDSSGPRPILYMVNGGQIIRAELPAPPRSFQENLTTPSAPVAPGDNPSVLPTAPSESLPTVSPAP